MYHILEFHIIVKVPYHILGTERLLPELEVIMYLGDFALYFLSYNQIVISFRELF